MLWRLACAWLTLQLRGAEIGWARVLQHRQIGLGRAQLRARAGDIAGARVALLLLLQLNLGRFELGLGGANIGLFRASLERAERRLGALQVRRRLEHLLIEIGRIDLSPDVAPC